MANYHELVNKVTVLVGYQYDDSAPEWIHPFIHLILVLAPALLGLVIIYLIVSAAQRFWERRHLVEPVQRSVRGLDQSLISTILRYSARQQVLMIALSLSVMPILYVTLELPKQIVNNALNSDSFPADYLGLSLTQVEFLFLLCGLYLGAILLSGANKYVLNVVKGFVAERLLRRLRLLVYRQWRGDRMSRKKSEIVPILSQEVEPIGGFAADVISLPLLQGGTLLTILLFMFIQDPLLGAAALTVLPLQLILLPKLQRRVNRYSRARIKEVRRLGRTLGDQLQAPLRADGDIPKIATSLRELEVIRRRIFRLKFFIKSLNNFLTSLTPFLFYSLGGYFVIEGRISLGALVAVLAAHKDFSAPLKELFAYYQSLEDTRIRYGEILDFFSRSQPIVSSQVQGNTSYRSVPA